jgi:hypothetical protein
MIGERNDWATPEYGAKTTATERIKYWNATHE